MRSQQISDAFLDSFNEHRDLYPYHARALFVLEYELNIVSGYVN